MNMINAWVKRVFSDPQMVLLVVLVLGLLAGTYLFAGLMAPAIAAIVIAFLLDGPVEWLKSKGSRHLTAVSLVFVTFMLIALIVILAILPPLIKQIGQFFNDIPSMVTTTQQWLFSLSVQFPDYISEAQIKEWFSKLGSELGNLGPRLLQYSLSGAASAMTTAVYAILIPVMVFFFMKDKKIILEWAASFLPSNRQVLDQVWTEVMKRSGDYVRGKLYEIIIVGSVAFVVYQVIGLQYATLLAVATGFSVLIPYFGAAVVTVPVALVALVQGADGPGVALAVIAYLILQALDGNLLAPLLFSEVVNLHPNAIIIAILLFGGIWGLWGVFFAIPLATVANAIIHAWRDRMANSIPAEEPSIE